MDGQRSYAPRRFLGQANSFTGKPFLPVASRCKLTVHGMATVPQSPADPNPNPQTGPPPRLHVLRDVVMDFSPAYFAMVMATGIVSLSAHMLGMPRLSASLFGLNIAAYAVIWLLSLLRVLWFKRLVLRDLVDH